MTSATLRSLLPKGASRIAVRRRTLLLAGASLLLTGCAETGLVTTDTARERKWATEIVPKLTVGEAVYLETPRTVRTIGREKFLALYTEARRPVGAVILCHGSGMNPDAGIIGLLRTDLAERGYTTLSIQMPILGTDLSGRAGTTDDDKRNYPLLFEDGGERIGAAAKFLQAKGYPKVAIVAYGMGARMSEFYLAHFAEAPIVAWVAISISNGEFAATGRVRVPTLDVYADNDVADVVKGASYRGAVLRAIPRSRQVKIANTDHGYTGKEVPLAIEIQRFLDGLSRASS
jgi:pimeloyl-ACP methyl ester carboxylesterase